LLTDATAGRSTPAKAVQSAALRRAIGPLVVGATFLAVYYPTLQKLTAYWADNGIYTYGFLVPLISAYLVWLRRERLRTIPRVPSFGFGGTVLTFGLTLLVIGRASSTNLVEELSLPFVVAGLSLVLGGTRLTQAMAFPIAYLLAMIPFWDFITDRLHATFQLYSAVVGVSALRVLGIPIIREGVLIHLPGITLEVADVCSGVNQLVAILCIGVPLTHLHVTRWSRRLFVLAASVLIALLSNGVRVAVIALYAFYGVRGADGDVHGPYSLLRTTFISAVGFLVLFWLISRLADGVSRGSSPVVQTSEPHTVFRMRASAVVLATALMLSVIAFERWDHVVDLPPSGHLSAVPTTIGRWRFAGNVPLSPSTEAAGFDHTVSRSYAAPDGLRIDLLVGYFERQRQDHELVGFRLSPLLAGDSRPSLRALGKERVADFRSTVDGQAYHVTYWYVLNGRIAAAQYEAKWWTMCNALVRRRNEGALVLVRSAIDPDESMDVAREKVRDFVEELVVASTHITP
jgi:EpsI family protein